MTSITIMMSLRIDEKYFFYVIEGTFDKLRNRAIAKAGAVG